MKKKLIILLLVVLTVISITPLLAGCADSKVRVFKVYNVQDYIDEELLDEFVDYYKEKTGETIKIQYDTFDTLERAYTIINNREADYDVVCPSDYIIEKMKKNNLLVKLDKSKIPNLKNIPPFLLDRAFDRGNTYSVPYMWGTLGVLYNTDKIKPEDVKGWDLLWNEKYKNTILMKDSIRDSVFIATIYAYRKELEAFAKTNPSTAEYNNYINELVNEVSEEKLEVVEKELRKQYDILYAYEVDSGKDSMINGEAYINLAWSGDAVWAIEEAANNGINLDYYVPQEGSNIWFDNWVISKYGKNPDISHEFINFLCDTEIALANMDYIGYTTAVISPETIDYMIDDEAEAKDFSYLFKDKAGNISEANKKLMAEYKEKYDIDFTSLKISEVVMPGMEKINTCVEMTDFGEKQDYIVKMWTRVKALPLGLEVKIFSVLLAATIIGIIGYSIYKKIVNRKKLVNKLDQIKENEK